MSCSSILEVELTKENSVWAGFDLAVSVFCHNCSTEVLQDNKLINTLVGEGMILLMLYRKAANINLMHLF